MIETLRTVYNDYMQTGAQPRKRGFGELFKGWLSGRGKPAAPVDARFARDVTACVGAVCDAGEPDAAFAAAEIILGVPRGNGVYERDLMLAAMHGTLRHLVPLLRGEDAGRALALLDQVPKKFWFPVQKQLKQQLQARQQAGDTPPPKE